MEQVKKSQEQDYASIMENIVSLLEERHGDALPHEIVLSLIGTADYVARMSFAVCKGVKGEMSLEATECSEEIVRKAVDILYESIKKSTGR